MIVPHVNAPEAPAAVRQYWTSRDALPNEPHLVTRPAVVICKTQAKTTAASRQPVARWAHASTRSGAICPCTEEEQEGTPLTIRTTRSVASFSEPFSLRGVEDVLPPGDYNVYFEDELVQGLSRAAYRRVSTILQIPSISSPQEQSRLVSISATDLEVVLMKDLHLTV
jgi:hypothetical protein